MKFGKKKKKCRGEVVRAQALQKKGGARMEGKSRGRSVKKKKNRCWIKEYKGGIMQNESSGARGKGRGIQKIKNKKNYERKAGIDVRVSKVFFFEMVYH